MASSPNPPLETLMLTLAAGDGLPGPPRALFLGAEPHPAMREWREVVGWQPLKPKADAWNAAGFPWVEDLPEARWPVVLVLPGKSRDETLFWFALARDHLEPGGRLVAAMPNTAGARRFERELARAAGGVVSVQKSRCRGFHVVDDGSWDETLFGQWRRLGEPRLIQGTSFVARAGIFSSDHVDAGSRLLADHLPADLRGRVADLGAGWGFLAHAALGRCPGIGRLELFEADARALACARQNLAGQARPIAYHWHDVTTGLPGSYDAILMNPPFHTGQATDVDLGRAFLTAAAAALGRGGQLLLVANRQLPYGAALEASGLAWRQVAEDRAYRVLFATRR